MNGSNGQIASTGFCVLRPTDGIDGRYIFYYVLTRDFIEKISALQRGVSYPAVRDGDVRAQPIPLAPTNEQRRIVEKIDELFSQIEAGEQALERAQKLLERYRQSVLNAAVTGELTRDWREKNPGCGDGSEALARAWAARKSLAAGAGAKFPDERVLNPGYLWDVPQTWTWCAVDEAGNVQLGQQRAPQHHRGRHMRPYLRVANVLEDQLDLLDVKEMNFEPHELPKFEIKPGDVLLNEGQSPELLGRSAVYNGEIDGCCIQKTLLRFRAFEGIDPRFAQIVFRHYMHSGRFRRIARITTNIGHITRVRFVEMEFPLPPTSEQEEIVNRFEAIDTNIKHLSREIAGSLRVQLRRCILAAAFSGKLVPQDPADEPASVLLERIAVERRAAEGPRPRHPRRGLGASDRKAGEQLELLA